MMSNLCLLFVGQVYYAVNCFCRHTVAGLLGSLLPMIQTIDAYVRSFSNL